MANDRKHVAIIGGSSGIGLAIARLAQQRGYALTIGGRNSDRLEAARRDLSDGSVATELVDAHDDASLSDFFERLPMCRHIVSMVGDPMSGGLLDCSIETLRHVMASKFIANVQIGKMARKRLEDGGSLTFTSAVGGRPETASGAYIGSLAIDALVEGLAVEMAPDIRVNAVAPTFTETGLWRQLEPEMLEAVKARFIDRIPLKRLPRVEEVASTYLFLMENAFITGQIIAVDGGVRLRAMVR